MHISSHRKRSLTDLHAIAPITEKHLIYSNSEFVMNMYHPKMCISINIGKSFLHIDVLYFLTLIPTVQ